MPHHSVTLYVTDAAGEPAGWLAGWLQERGARVRTLATLADLTLRLRELQNEEEPPPILVLIAAEEADEALLAFCGRLQRLGEEGRLGIIPVVHGAVPAAAVVRRAREAGCLDLFPFTAREPCAGAEARLGLARQLLEERYLRSARERMYQAQLAQRRVAEARLHYSATHDELTDLANRRALEQALDRAIADGKRRRFSSALLYVDLDRFKLHNDAAGHGSGDHLLRLVGDLLRSVFPPEYLCARLGSDEFAVLMPGSQADEALALAECLRARVAAIEPDGEKIVYHVGISAGVAVIEPGAVTGASQALAQAEQACYVAKTRGGNAVHRFCHDDGALQHLRDDMRWALPIRSALQENRFFLVFQPILSVAENRISHYEALLRIPKALGGDDETAHFMPAAERLGLARQIDLWIVENAIAFLAAQEEVSLGVNLSSHAFQEPALLPLLHDRLEMTAIAPERLTFEITETAAITNFAETRRMIGEIRNLGCRFALDDFGSGFSSYNYIKQFPVDMLKIDGSFVVGLRQDRRDQAIVRSMVEIGHGLDKEVVAEYIEDEETLALLVEIGIDYAQGFLIGRPSPQIPASGARRSKENER